MLANKTVMEATKKLPSSTYTVKAAKYNNRYLVSVFANSEDDIIKLARILYGFNFNIDMGLMQISKQHLSSADEINYIFNPKYNLGKGSNVLADCVNKYKVLPQSIECYNKGFRFKNDLDYYRKFTNSFNGHFGEKR
jgi:type IV secretion system protein VirB1